MGERPGESDPIPGERVETPVKRAELYLPLYALGAVWIVLLLPAWNGVAGWLRGETSELPPFELAWLVGVLAGGLVVGALALRAVRRTARTVLTTEGVWRPGWLGGGRFLRWAEVESADFVRGGHGGITHLRLRHRRGRMLVRLNAFERPSRITRLVRRSVREGAAEEGPLEDPE